MDVAEVRQRLDGIEREIEDTVRRALEMKVNLDTVSQSIMAIRATSAHTVGLPAVEQMKEKLNEMITAASYAISEVQNYRAGI